MKCTCGADKLKMSVYNHSVWCDFYLPPPPINELCSCGVGGWHSPLCRFRQWPKEPVDKIKEEQRNLKYAIDKLVEEGKNKK